MRTVTKQQVDQLQVSGGRVRKLTETPKPPAPAPEIPDHTDQLAAIEKSIGEIRARGQEVALYGQAEQDRLQKVVDHLSMQLHQLHDELANKQHPPKMIISKGPQGFIASVRVGGLVFKFNRNRIGTCTDIDILTR